MTVVAWDGRTLAADKRAVNCGLSRTVTKIRRIGDALVAVSGGADHMEDLFQWVANGRRKEDYPKYQETDDGSVLLMILGGRAYTFDRTALPFEIEDPFTAIGSGRDYAIAAMHLGKTAVEAVEIACVFDTSCGNGIDVLEAWQCNR